VILLSIVLFSLAVGAAELLHGKYGQTASLAERTVRRTTKQLDWPAQMPMRGPKTSAPEAGLPETTGA
jgi:hypothetical protein